MTTTKPSGKKAAVWDLAEVAGSDGEGSAGGCEGCGVYAVKVKTCA